MQKIIRSLCYFTEELDDTIPHRLSVLKAKIEKAGYQIQTERICADTKNFIGLETAYPQKNLLLSIGKCDLKYVIENKYDFFKAARTSCHIDITSGIEMTHVEFLFDIIKEAPEKLFQFAFVANNASSSPYFPSAKFAKNGFALGMQSTDLGAGCKSLQDWFANMQQVWAELIALFGDTPDFLGIDSSVAPLFSGDRSLVSHINRFYGSFEEAILSDTFLKITHFIKTKNPKPVGLCGLMFPCLEDFELAKLYEQGSFGIERNLFLSMHSGLGIDTYPIAVDEPPERVLSILKLLRGLSNKYQKPLSARFISDGKAKLGEQTNFGNQFLKDVIVGRL